MALPSSFFGTALTVRGTWYVRYEGGGGVLLPVQADDGLKSTLNDGSSYNFSGRIVYDDRGHPKEASVTGAKPIGDHNRGA